MEPTFFPTPAAFRRWLKKNHRTARELFVGFYKKGTGRPSITWPEAVDEALCFAWIDGVRRTIDDESYVIRFTPRRPGSNWSLINIRKVKALIREGRMQPAGLAAFEARKAEKSGVYSFEQRENAKLDRKAEAKFKANKAAWKFFQSQPPGYRKVAVFYVMSAKREETRAKRLQTLIDDSAAGLRIGLLRRE
ncbi:MAG TPA: YdeI/OmpD-associated family protein [Thermoanaerobaculia bacterium]|nr:YdeI/OmpD-associated family protein [Thermoanaerobaculia bacterium]